MSDLIGYEKANKSHIFIIQGSYKSDLYNFLALLYSSTILARADLDEDVVVC